MSIMETGRVAALIKKHHPRSTVVVGGIHAAALPDRTLQEFPSIDYVVLGEGEFICPEIVQRLRSGSNLEGMPSIAYRNNGTVVTNLETKPILELDVLEPPDRDLWPVQEYREIWKYVHDGKDPMGLVMSSRGCPGRCKFCASGSDAIENKVRFRSVENVAAEIDYLRETYGVKHLEFIDDCFSINKRRMKEMCEYLEGTGLTWVCKSRVDTLNREILSVMKRAGCQSIFLGLESLDPPY